MRNHSKDIKDIQGSAYDKALKSLTQEEQSRLETSDFQDARQLLQNLNNSNDKSCSDSRMRTGLTKLKPKLETVQQAVDIAGIFGEAEPTGALSVICGLTSAACSAGIRLANAADNLDTEVKLLFDLAPRLIQCDGLTSSTKNPELIRNDLVRVYTGMFKFYLVAMKILDHESFLVALREHKDEMSEAVAGFSSYWHQFLEGVQIDTLETTTDTLGAVRKIQIADILEKECAHESEYRPPTPAANTCQWLSSADGYRLWHQSTTMNTHFLTMFGAMGSGKTVATAYLAGHLRSESKDRTVISYYIHSDGERSKPTNIYCSLIKQFISWHPGFEALFLGLLQEHSVVDPQRQARRPEVLRRSFVGLLDAADKRVCILLDALDALDLEAQEELGQLFGDLLKLKCQCKVFLTSQPDNHIKRLIPGKIFEIGTWRKQVCEENHLIAKHLMDKKWFEDDRRNQYEEEDRQHLIKGIAKLADSSPLMVYLNVAHADALTREATYRTVDEVLHIVGGAPSRYSKIPRKWAEIRRQVLERLDVGDEVIDPLLRFLAITSRPVTIREACAFVIYDTQDGDKMPRELDAHGQKRIIEWIRPFVATDDESDPNSVLSLYHNSLQKLIILKEPSAWDTETAIKDNKQYDQRKAQMNGELASKCLRYLCFPECSSEGFIKSGVPRGNFFNYAACTWQHHLASSAGPTAQQVECIMAICKPGSTVLRNWTDQNSRYERTFLPELSELDPLVVLVHFRLEKLTSMLLDRPDAFEPPNFSPTSATTVLTCALQTERFPLATAIITKAGPRLNTLEAWKQLMQAYNPALDFWLPKPPPTSHNDPKSLSTEKRARKAIARREQTWQAFLDPLIPRLLADLRNKPGCAAAAALREAVANNCLSVVAKLLSHAASDAELRRKLLLLVDDPRGGGEVHQVVGVAAQQGNVEMLDLLLGLGHDQAGNMMEKHVRHLGPGGETVFHAAAQMVCSEFRPEVFAVLRRVWPEGADVLDERGRHFRDLLRPGESELVG
ncbi:hypothetical protein SLS55_006250 [Diplodia seriata]|uniref:Nephrocystin 3-like N-terminal domain-containing protein n=1 Tax=Diplodia seriata TaxID=420778 RepID=A0ABR3CDN5_9PEZI